MRKVKRSIFETSRNLKRFIFCFPTSSLRSRLFISSFMLAEEGIRRGGGGEEG